jgi:hypothetical protein
MTMADLYDPNLDDEPRPHPEVDETMQNIAAAMQDSQDSANGLQAQDLQAIKAWLQNIVSMASADPSIAPEILTGASEAIAAIEAMLPPEPRAEGEVEQLTGKGLQLGEIVQKHFELENMQTWWGSPGRGDPGQVFAHLFTGKR